MKLLQLASCALCVLICMGASRMSHAQGWSEGTYQFVPTVRNPNPDTVFAINTFGSHDVTSSTHRQGASAEIAGNTSREFLWTGGVPIPMTLTLYYGGRVSGYGQDNCTASSLVQPSGCDALNRTINPPITFSYGGMPNDAKSWTVIAPVQVDPYEGFSYVLGSAFLDTQASNGEAHAEASCVISYQ